MSKRRPDCPACGHFHDALTSQITRFVDKWGPGGSTPVGQKTQRQAFVTDLRTIMNAYAEAALDHGNPPETGKPHGIGRSATKDLLAACKAAMDLFKKDHAIDLTELNELPGKLRAAIAKAEGRSA